MYKINVNDRNYREYTIVDSKTLKKVNIQINAVQHKLFTQDIFTIHETGVVNIEHSSDVSI